MYVKDLFLLLLIFFLPFRYPASLACLGRPEVAQAPESGDRLQRRSDKAAPLSLPRLPVKLFFMGTKDP